MRTCKEHANLYVKKSIARIPQANGSGLIQERKYKESGAFCLLSVHYSAKGMFCAILNFTKTALFHMVQPPFPEAI
jgi:hypothetical protein